jgi:hypothetical protein
VDLTVLQAAKITELYGAPLGTWMLTYRGRVYLRQRDGTYSMQRKSRVQRSRRPASPALLSTNGELNGGYEVVGEFPSLPAVVRCPGCNLRAYIGVPGG